jgi:hypothetical protein
MRHAKLLALILAGTILLVAASFGPYAAHQYQRGKMKTTITRMRTLGVAIDSQRKPIHSCREAAEGAKLSLECEDAWGDPIHLEQSVKDPSQYVIWCQGKSAETARFVYLPSGFTRLPGNAPP